MLQELKGSYINVPLKKLHKLYRDKDKIPANELTSHIVNLPISKTSSRTFIYYLIDFYEWINALLKDIEYREYIEDVDIILETIPKYREFMIYTSYRIGNPARVERIFSEYLDTDFLNDIFICYEIFMRYVEKTQIEFFNIFINNTANNPVALVPWSYGLNRLTDTICLVQEDEEKHPLSDIVISPNKGIKSGLTNKYYLKSYYIQDGMERPIKQSPISLYHYDIDYETEDLLPKAWTDVFDNNIYRTTGKYKERLKLIKALFTQYLFYGRHNIDGNKVFYLNYPFLLPEATPKADEIRNNLVEKIDGELTETFEILEDNKLS